MRFTALATLSGLALVLFACSGEAPTASTKGNQTTSKAGDKDNDTDTKKPTSGTAPTGGTTQTTDPTNPAPTTDGAQCASQTKADACFDCCDPSKTAFEASDKVFGDCICGTSGKCATQCAQTFCNAQNPSEPAQGDACDTCLQQNYASCDQAAGDVCDKDANCKKASDCVQAAKCFEKAE
jgi:hypothetical protein